MISQAEFDQSAATLRGLEANLKAAAANIRSAEKVWRRQVLQKKDLQQALKS